MAIKVRATRNGFYNERRRIGDEFTVDDFKLVEGWAEKVSAPKAKPKAKEPAQSSN